MWLLFLRLGEEAWSDLEAGLLKWKHEVLRWMGQRCPMRLISGQNKRLYQNIGTLLPAWSGTENPLKLCPGTSPRQTYFVGLQRKGSFFWSCWEDLRRLQESAAAVQHPSLLSCQQTPVPALYGSRFFQPTWSFKRDGAGLVDREMTPLLSLACPSPSTGGLLSLCGIPPWLVSPLLQGP